MRPHVSPAATARLIFACGLIATSLAAPAAARAATTLSQSTSPTITPDNTVFCGNNDGSAHRQNSYYRRFHLPDHGITGAFAVTSVTFGIEFANDGSDAGQPVSVRIHSIPAGALLTVANLTLLNSVDITVLDSEGGTLRTVAISGTISNPNTTDLVLEVFLPDGVAGVNKLLIGSNTLPESKPSYIRAPDCSFNEPTTTAIAGFPTHLVLFATGDEGLDTFPPNIRVRIPTGQRLPGVVRNGLRAVIRSNEACSVRVKLILRSALATRLGIPTGVGLTRVAFTGAGRKVVVTNFTRRAKRKLAGLNSFTVLVEVRADDPAGNERKVRLPVRLTR
jgi:hypothetical protein